MKITLFAAVAAAALLSACGSANMVTADMSAANKARFMNLATDADALREFFSDTTIKSWNSFHGTQIEYHAANGRTWLVYPGNTRSVLGEWKIKPNQNRPQMCYRYGRNSYNPITRQWGGAWECRSVVSRLDSDEIVDGDVLKLVGRGAYPQPLPTEINISIDTVMQEVGLGPLRARNKADWHDE